jgi:phage terminase large subunit
LDHCGDRRTRCWWGAVDRLIELGLPVTPYNGGEGPIDKERFVDARAEDYWTLRELFENDEIDIDAGDDKLAAQLRAIKWTVDSRCRIKSESKDDMRKRGLPSPDRADTVAMAFSGRHKADRSTSRVMPAKSLPATS